MTEAPKIIESLKKDLRNFFERKRIKERLNELMDLFDPDEEDSEKMPPVLVSLVDSLNDISEIIYK